MVAAVGRADVLLAYPLVGPNVEPIRPAAFAYPETTFRATVDDPERRAALSRPARGSNSPSRSCSTWRSAWAGPGSSPDRPPSALSTVGDLPNLVPDGLHAYDGHIRDSDLEERREAAAAGA